MEARFCEKRTVIRLGIIGIGVLGLAARASGTCPGEVAGSTCVCDQFSTNTICLDWQGTGDNPVEVTDFNVDYDCTGCYDAPEIDLINGAHPWVVRARTSTGLGDIGVIKSPYADDFSVSLGTGFSDQGAMYVGSIKLDPTGDHYSTIANGYIIYLTDAFYIEEDSGGDGGECTLFINSLVDFAMTIPKVGFVTLIGGVEHKLTVGEIVDGGGLNLGDLGFGPCGEDTEVSATVEVGTIGAGASLTITGDLDGDLTITEIMESQSLIRIRGTVGSSGEVTIAEFDEGAYDAELKIGETGTCAIGGDITLSKGISSGGVVKLLGSLSSGGTIDLTNDDVAGVIGIRDGGAGSIVNGGAISGLVWVSDVGTAPFSGTATFTSVTSTGEFKTTSGADVTGTVTVSGTMAGTIDVADDLSGEVSIGTDLTGTVTVGDNLSDDISVDGDVTSTGSIEIDGALVRYGRILIDGACDGDITIGEGISATSFIHIDDGFDGSLQTGTATGSFDVDGDILFGPETIPLTLLAYSFDGCVDIDGDLDGDIDVIGCLDLDPPICVEGDTNGTITLNQGDCDPNNYEVDDTCPACP